MIREMIRDEVQGENGKRIMKARKDNGGTDEEVLGKGMTKQSCFEVKLFLLF